MALPITLYGATHCEDTAATKAHLHERDIPYKEINIDHDPEAERFVIFINGGARSTPTLVLGDGKLKLVLTEPTLAELDEVLPARKHA
ncbi:MAG TPA: glutaredoxin family protein [Ktedonobacteraceae bacterium]|nr:glutaredoxin family protein [Ktedonobacteraceae bacterium]